MEPYCWNNQYIRYVVLVFYSIDFINSHGPFIILSVRYVYWDWSKWYAQWRRLRKSYTHRTPRTPALWKSAGGKVNLLASFGRQMDAWQFFTQTAITCTVPMDRLKKLSQLDGTCLRCNYAFLFFFFKPQCPKVYVCFVILCISYHSLANVQTFDMKSCTEIKVLENSLLFF